MGNPRVREYYNTSTLPVPARAVASRIESWFAQNERSLPWRATYDPYLVWVSEVMLQQTRMEVVLRHYSRFVERFPTMGALAAATQHDVLTTWSGLGYYRRARMLHAGAQHVVSQFGGILPNDVAALQTIPGIGRYTAGAIASIAYNERAPIVDGNVARVVSRLTSIAEPVGSPALMGHAWSLAGELVAACEDPRALNQGLMELGALVCTPRNPGCTDCPVQTKCAAHAEGRIADCPAPRQKQSARKMTVHLYLIDDGRGRVLMRRESGALMTSMFHLPHGSTALLTGRPLRVTTQDLVGTFKHTITNRNVEFRVHRATLASRVREGDEYAWVDPSRLGDVPHPSYVAKALRLVSPVG